MFQNEIFSGLSAIPPIFVRIDGRAFHTLTKGAGFKKPFDEGFMDLMASVASMLISESGLEPLFAYVFSDEINLYFKNLPFGGRVEKIDSVCASYAAGAFVAVSGFKSPVSFDSRIIFSNESDAPVYLEWRQREAWRNHINAYCQHALVIEGMTEREAADALKGVKSAEMHEMMFERGINLSKTPSWQRRGVIVRHEQYIKTGYNPVEKKEVLTERSKITIDKNPPLFHTEEGKDYLFDIIRD
ncbi:MAG: tRNA 5'-guanylyltransferase [Methanomicrobiaceae archaeon]|nr:tRNA 5'-guanylyltransferase [Methanomicrobiaceae archaeon]